MPTELQVPTTKRSKSHIYRPTQISAALNIQYNHFIIYPTSSGYCFAMFYRSEKIDPFEIIGGSYKPYKIKADCIKAMKKIMSGFGDTMWRSYIHAYDHNGNKISLKIEYDIKKLL